MARLKKDIDRELMYKKILPTAVSSQAVAAPAGMQEEDRPYERQIPAQMTVSITEPVKVVMAMTEDEPAESPADIPEEAPMQGDGSIAQSEPVFEPALEQTQQPQAAAEPALVNLMEGFLEKRMDDALEKFKCCTCERCRNDILAMALNKLPALYVIEEDADLRDLYERERSAQVATALVQAILAVKAHPAHG